MIEGSECELQVSERRPNLGDTPSEWGISAEIVSERIAMMERYSSIFVLSEMRRERWAVIIERSVSEGPE